MHCNPTLLLRFRRVNTDSYHVPIYIRYCFQFCYIYFRYVFHPYGLPDTALSRIKHATCFYFLLPFGVIRCITAIFHSYCKFICPIMHSIGNIQFKRKISSRMSASLMSIHIHNTCLVHCSKVKNQTMLLQLYFIHIYGTLVPQIFLRLQLTIHS